MLLCAVFLREGLRREARTCRAKPRLIHPWTASLVHCTNSDSCKYRVFLSIADARATSAAVDNALPNSNRHSITKTTNRHLVLAVATSWLTSSCWIGTKLEVRQAAYACPRIGNPCYRGIHADMSLIMFCRAVRNSGWLLGAVSIDLRGEQFGRSNHGNQPRQSGKASRCRPSKKQLLSQQWQQCSQQRRRKTDSPGPHMV